MPASIHPAPPPSDHGTQLQFVPVPGGLVFAVCALLIVICFVEFGLRLSKAWRKWEEE